MELLMAAVIAVLFAGGTYLVLRPNLIRVVMGFGLYSNAANLLMITCGGYDSVRTAPFVAEGAETAALMDPLPPDIILTAIVISFAVGALLLTVSYRVYLDHGTDNPEELVTEDPADEPLGAETAEESMPDVIAELSQPSEDAPREMVASPLRPAPAGQ